MSGQGSTDVQSASETLPPGWTTKAAGEVADIKLGKMLDRQKHASGTPLPYLRNINVRWGEFDTSDLREMFFDENEIERYSVRSGDLVVCEGGEPGRAAIWKHTKPAMFQKALHRVRPFADVSSQWLLLCLRRYASSGELMRFVSGSTIKHFTREAFSRLPIPLPPPPEQRRIVARLEALEAWSRRAREKLAAVPAQLARARQSLLAAAFRGDLTADWRRANPPRGKDGPKADAETAWTIPDGWTGTHLENLIPRGGLFDGPFGSHLKSDDYTPEGVRVIRLENIGHLSFDDEKQTFISEEKYATLTRHTVVGGDLIFASFIFEPVRVCILPQLTVSSKSSATTSG